MSFTEILIIMALALLLFGPDELPKMAKQLGKGLRELRRATDDIKSTIETEMNKMDEEPKRAPAGTPLILPPIVDTHDPGAARAAARFVASGKPPPVAAPEAQSTAPESAQQLPAPEAAEKATEPLLPKLTPPEGAVARETAAPPAAESAKPAEAANHAEAAKPAEQPPAPTGGTA